MAAAGQASLCISAPPPFANSLCCTPSPEIARHKMLRCVRLTHAQLPNILLALAMLLRILFRLPDNVHVKHQ